jgi:hypothetical protein
MRTTWRSAAVGSQKRNQTLPVTGYPDSSVHKLCIRCRKWHTPEEGVMIAARGSGFGADPITAVVSGLSHLLVPCTRERFICHRCRRIRATVSIVIGATFTLLITSVLVLEYYGLI